MPPIADIAVSLVVVILPGAGGHLHDGRKGRLLVEQLHDPIRRHAGQASHAMHGQRLAGGQFDGEVASHGSPSISMSR